jgi:hypothetical protein
MHLSLRTGFSLWFGFIGIMSAGMLHAATVPPVTVTERTYTSTAIDLDYYPSNSGGGEFVSDVDDDAGAHQANSSLNYTFPSVNNGTTSITGSAVAVNGGSPGTRATIAAQSNATSANNEILLFTSSTGVASRNNEFTVNSATLAEGTAVTLSYSFSYRVNYNFDSLTGATNPAVGYVSSGYDLTVYANRGGNDYIAALSAFAGSRAFLRRIDSTGATLASTDYATGGFTYDPVTGASSQNWSAMMTEGGLSAADGNGNIVSTGYYATLTGSFDFVAYVGETFNVFTNTTTGAGLTLNKNESGSIWIDSLDTHGYSFDFNGQDVQLSGYASAVPEPATWALLMGIAALGLAGVRRRMTKN